MRYTIQTRNWLKLRRSEVKVWKRQTRLEYFTMLDQADRLIYGHRPIHREKIRFGAWEESPEVEISFESQQRRMDALEKSHGDQVRARIEAALEGAGLPVIPWRVNGHVKDVLWHVVTGKAEL